MQHLGAYSQYFIFFTTQELARQVRVFDTDQPFQLCYGTVQLIGKIRKLQRKWSVVNAAPGCVFTILYFLRNLGTGPLSQSV